MTVCPSSQKYVFPDYAELTKLLMIHMYQVSVSCQHILLCCG